MALLALQGIGTVFKKEFQVGDNIRFVPMDKDSPKLEDQVIESVESETELTLKEPGVMSAPIEKSYKFKILPKIDQSKVFKDVINHLG